MALRDVKKYYYSQLNQYIECKENLADFEEALKNGYITEDKLEEEKAWLNNLEINKDRLAYILYLFELPNKKEKRKKFNKANSDVAQYFKDLNADEESVYNENKSIISQLKASIKAKLKK